jgi:hypothetical protein
MKVGDLVKRKVQRTFSSTLKGYNSLAIIVGFDYDGDLRLFYANPGDGWENREDVDYISAWELIDESR